MLLLHSCSLSQSPIQSMGSACYHHGEAQWAAREDQGSTLRGTSFHSDRDSPSFRDLQGRVSLIRRRTSGLKRKGGWPNAEAGARARAGSAAEIHGSGSKTGEAVKDPERLQAASQAGETRLCGKEGPGGPSPSAEGHVGSKNQVGAMPGFLDLRAEAQGIQTFTFSRKVGISSSAIKGCGKRIPDF